MTAIVQSLATEASFRRDARPFLGFGTLVRKEVQDWVRGRRGLIVALVSIATSIFTTLIPVIAKATTEPGQTPEFSLDPTANVLFGWSGMNVALVLVLATMSLIAIERDRGTLAWSLTKPVSRAAVLAAKWVAAFGVLGLLAIVTPLAIQVGVATIVYGGLPDLAVVAGFGALYLTVPAFFVTLTVALGAVVPSTPGVAALAFLVLFLPAAVAGFVPAVDPYLPTNMHLWALSVVQGQPAPVSLPVAWAVSIVILALGAKLAFDRQEF
jgi:ABC-2 type transport system permease protein